MILEKIVLYSTGCPRCTVLKSKLNSKHIAFDEVNDVDQMEQIGISTVPWLSVNGELLEFADAVRWVNMQGVRV